MDFMRKYAKPLIPIISFTLFFLSCYVPSAYAGVVSTQTIVDNAKLQQERKHLRQFYTRNDVKSALNKYGISATEAQARIESMTDQEVHLISQRIDKMPAGAGGAEAVLIVFLVLLVLELMHVTNIFSFI